MLDLTNPPTDFIENPYPYYRRLREQFPLLAQPDGSYLISRHNRHLAFAGGPHSCLGLNRARMEGRIAIGRFLQRYPGFEVTESKRSHRLRFRGFTQLILSLGNT